MAEDRRRNETAPNPARPNRPSPIEPGSGTEEYLMSSYKAPDGSNTMSTPLTGAARAAVNPGTAWLAGMEASRLFPVGPLL